MISNILMVVGRLVCVLAVFILFILVWKTLEYFTAPPDSNKYKPLLAWDTLMLFLTMVFCLARLIMT